MNSIVLCELINRMQIIGSRFGYQKIITRSSAALSEIYVMNEHAIQLEIDWKENDLFMYAVYLKDKKLPNEKIIYQYDDGHWCRKYLEEIFNVSRQRIKNRKDRYSTEYLFACLDFYDDLIKNNPMLLEKTFQQGTFK